MLKRHLILTGLALASLTPAAAPAAPAAAAATTAPAADACAAGPYDGKIDERLLGAWRPQYYTLDGVKHPLRGLMVFTPHYFMANVVIDNADGDPGANANSGPYTIKCSKIAMIQWMQMHYRPGTQDPVLLTEGVPEAIAYDVTTDSLTFKFPSGNSYVSKRIPKP
jgi:hypothetical protein